MRLFLVRLNAAEAHAFHDFHPYVFESSASNKSCGPQLLLLADESAVRHFTVRVFCCFRRAHRTFESRPVGSVRPAVGMDPMMPTSVHAHARDLDRLRVVLGGADLDLLVDDVVDEGIVADDKHMPVLLLQLVEEPRDLHSVVLVHHEKGLVDDEQVASSRPRQFGEGHLDGQVDHDALHPAKDGDGRFVRVGRKADLDLVADARKRQLPAQERASERVDGALDHRQRPLEPARHDAPLAQHLDGQVDGPEVLLEREDLGLSPAVFLTLGEERRQAGAYGDARVL